MVHPSRKGAKPRRTAKAVVSSTAGRSRPRKASPPAPAEQPVQATVGPHGPVVSPPAVVKIMDQDWTIQPGPDPYYTCGTVDVAARKIILPLAELNLYQLCNWVASAAEMAARKRSPSASVEQAIGGTPKAPARLTMTPLAPAAGSYGIGPDCPVPVPVPTRRDLFTLIGRVESLRHEAHHLAVELEQVLKGFELPQPTLVWAVGAAGRLWPRKPRGRDGRPLEPDGVTVLGLADASARAEKPAGAMAADWFSTWHEMLGADELPLRELAGRLVEELGTTAPAEGGRR